MSTGSRREDFDFGASDMQGARSPMPADIAQPAPGSLPSDRAQMRGRPKRERGHIGRGGQDGKPEGGQQGGYEPELLVDDKVERRKKRLIIGAVLVVVSILSLFVDAGYGAFFDPGEVFACYGVWFEQTFGGGTLSYNEILQVHPAYLRILPRIGTTLMTIICGVILSVAGTLYQSAFRNPIASPSMLGVASAIQLGDCLLVIVFSSAAAAQIGWRIVYCYTCVIVVMVLLFVCTRLMTGKGRPFNVVNMLLVATILTQLVGVVVTYVTNYLFTYEEWEIYTRVSEGLNMNLTAISWIALAATCVIGLVPVIVLRFRLNALNFTDPEMRLLGIDSTKLRLLALVCGTVLVSGAQLQMGTVAMVSLVVPHISRMIFGAEFRKQFWGNVLIGAALLVLCTDIVGFIPVVGPMLPVSVVVNFIVLPFFVWMLATQQRGWEQ